MAELRIAKPRHASCSSPSRSILRGTLKAWALKLNMPRAAKLIDQTLAEEKKTDETLTKIAETAVNYEAAA